jgi:hypothetical protein
MSARTNAAATTIRSEIIAFGSSARPEHAAQLYQSTSFAAGMTIFLGSRDFAMWGAPAVRITAPT